MKEIMYKESTTHTDGVASFEYNPRGELSERQKLLFQLSTPLDELQNSLLYNYQGRTVAFEQLYEEHSIDKPFIKKNYKEVLRKMLDSGTIQAVGKDGKIPKRGFAEHNTITFPNSIKE